MAQDSYIVWLIPRGQVLVREDGPTWDFDADRTDPASFRFRWDDVVESIAAWVDAVQVPVLMEHEERTEGEPVEIYGTVSEVFALTADEARAAGIEATELTDALYARVIPGADLADLRTSGKVGLGSPNLQAGFRDDTAREWPIVLWEYSHTYAPRQRSRQPTPESMLAAALSDPRRTGMAVKKQAKLNDTALDAVVEATEEATDAGAEEAGAEGMTDVAAAISALHAVVEALAAKVDALSAGGETTDEAAAMADEEEEKQPDDPITMSDPRVRKIVAEEVRRQAALAREMEALQRSYVVPEKTLAALRDLRSTNPAAYTAVVSALPKRKPGTVLPAGTAMSDERNKPTSERAMEYAKQHGVSYSKAVEAIQKGSKNA